jgi:hypothetical protein
MINANAIKAFEVEASGGSYTVTIKPVGGWFLVSASKKAPLPDPYNIALAVLTRDVQSAVNALIPD